VLVPHHRDIGATGGRPIPLVLLLGVAVADGRSDDDGRTYLPFALAVQGGLLHRRFGQFAAARAELAQLKDLLQTLGAEKTALCLLLEEIENIKLLLHINCAKITHLRSIHTGLALLFLLLLAPHNVLGALEELVLGKRDGQLEQELLVDGLQVVEGHAVGVDDGVQDVVQRVEVLVQAKFVKQFAETKWGTRSTIQAMPINQAKPSPPNCKKTAARAQGQMQCICPPARWQYSPSSTASSASQFA